jgi:hypothetical protein
MATAAPVFKPGFQLPWGADLNALSAGINNLTGNGTPGAVTASTLSSTGNVSDGSERQDATPALLSDRDGGRCDSGQCDGDHRLQGHHHRRSDGVDQRRAPADCRRLALRW